MKTILITGASSGIGRACAERLASDDARLILCSRDIGKLDMLAGELKEKASKVFVYGTDVRKRDSVEAMFDDLDEKGISVDIIINNAGLALGLDDIKDADTEDWDTMIDTNMKGLLYVTRRYLRQMTKNSPGHVINIGSIAGIYAYPKGAVYAATKAAVRFISDGLRKELVDRNIKVTNIQPGLVETDFSKVRFHGDQAKAKGVYEGIKALTPEDIADVVAYAITRPSHVQICEVTVTPLHQASVDVIHKH